MRRRDERFPRDELWIVVMGDESVTSPQTIDRGGCG
jgi:hypothetical protein